MEAQAVKIELERHLFTVDEYDQMITAGIFNEDDRIELLEGQIINMSPIGVPHSVFVRKLDDILHTQLAKRAIISVQNPIRLSNTSEPQPDLVALRTRADYYADAHPGPADILLLIEVSDSTLALDKKIKVPLYAQGMIPEVWIIDVNGKAAFQYLQPSPTGYQTTNQFGKGDTLSAATIADLSINLDDLFA